jgi:RNA polymerase sigma factor (sigma-70 family)
VTVEFDAHRGYLRGVAYRLLGSLADADDAVQECWLRARGAATEQVRDPRRWLGTVVARICLDMLRARAARREVPLLPDPLVSPDDPEGTAERADAVGLALLIVLDDLSPAERVAFVLHDAFGVPFEEIAPLVGRSVAATRQLASRGRRRARAAPAPDPDLARQRRAVTAFLAAARDGDLDGLVALLDPDIRLRADTPAGRRTVRGAARVAGEAARFSARVGDARPVLVNGAAGLLVAPAGRAVALMAFTVAGDRIVDLAIYADPARLRAMH